MELVVGASEATMRSLLTKLGGLLADEYTLIRGVNADIQYINDELATMQSFLRAYNGSHGDLMKDWVKQIRDITYDIEDCVDDAGNRIHGLRTTGVPCYFIVNSVYEVLTWWPRRDIASKISVLRMRAQQIGERRDRYGVAAPHKENDETSSGKAARFDVADNQAGGLLQLVTTKNPVGVKKHMGKLDKRVTCIVGFGGVGKTAIANALYRDFGEEFSHRAMVTVSQSSDLDAILTNIRDQVKPHTSNHEQQDGIREKKNCPASAMKGIKSTVMSAIRCGCGTSEEMRETGSRDQVKPHTNNHEKQDNSEKKKDGSEKKDGLVAAGIKHLCDHLTRGASALMAKSCKCLRPGTSEQKRDRDHLKNELAEHFNKNRYLVLIDDVWSAATLDSIINALPENVDSRIIVTTRFHDVATTRRDADIRIVKGLVEEKSKELFIQAFHESKGKKRVVMSPQPPATISKGEEESSKQAISETEGSKDVPDQVWKMCGGLPLAIVIMAGHVACNPHKSHMDWLALCKSLFPEPERGHPETGVKELTQEEAGKIVSHCYNDMPAEIKTCSMYLSIFPKGYRFSRKRLTRRWIAESFVCEKEGLSAEDVAEAYFNHLIRRKIIQPVEHNSNGKVKKCIVHDMVLELIVAKASEENFITVVGGSWLMQPPSSKVRRLSLQGSDSKHAKDTEKMNLSHVRSLTMFGSLNNQLPSHSFKFGIAQVLDLEGCKDFKQHHIKEICKMLLLKYLSLRKTDTKLLDDDIGKLKNLETLDIRETKIFVLPNTVCELERLVNILGGDKTTRQPLKLPEDLKKKKKMKTLRILSGIEIDEQSSDLRHLTELRKLAIYKLKTMGSDASVKELRSSIEYLGGYSLQTLVIDDETSDFVKSLDGLSSPPRFLVALELSGKMIKLPNWIKQLSVLNKLTLSLTALRADNLKDLSKLDALFSLTFSLRSNQHDRQIFAIIAENKLYSDGAITVSPGGFSRLKLLCLSGPLLPLLRFSKDAMPELERLELRFSMLEGIVGAENLTKLKEVDLTSDNKIDEDQITKEIVHDMGALRRIEGQAPRIMCHQSFEKKDNVPSATDSNEAKL